MQLITRSLGNPVPRPTVVATPLDILIRFGPNAYGARTYISPKNRPKTHNESHIRAKSNGSSKTPYMISLD